MPCQTQNCQITAKTIGYVIYTVLINILIMDFSQIMILLFGCSAIWLIARKEEWKRWGYIIGLIAQPFWLYTSITNEQWGIVALTVFYTYSWGMGIYNYWIKRE